MEDSTTEEELPSVAVLAAVLNALKGRHGGQIPPPGDDFDLLIQYVAHLERLWLSLQLPGKEPFFQKK